MHKLARVSQGALLAACAAIAFPAVAQENRTADVLLEEIIVTGTKRAGGIDVQDAPVAITAYNESQLDAMHIRDVSAIGYSAPSVQLEDIGTTRGTANFSIRGLGINSSIPSIDPTVGVFVDGVYLGINSGVVLDIFDLEGIEVLRGPQGLLFGRNVTGGAVLLRTTRPSDEFRFKGRLASETGSNIYASALLTGPLGDRVRGKLAVHRNDDGGWHTNQATGESHGAAETTVVRGALGFDLTDSFDVLLRYEHGESEGDGPASQNAGLFSTESFDFAIDEKGFYDNEWNQFTLEATADSNWGDGGEWTFIAGYRDYASSTMGDIDASFLDLPSPPFPPIPYFFHAPSRLDQEQTSQELRYAGQFGNVYLTAGLYNFRQEMLYLENRLIPPAGLNITGGGTQETSTQGMFLSLDVATSDTVTLNFGGRLSRETKEAAIASILRNTCTLDAGCSATDFNDTRSFSNFTPKIGIQIQPSEDTLFYSFLTKGFRAGGYNMRHTALLIPNQGFGDEEQTSFEVGLKRDFADGRVRINAAFYNNTIEDMQREINLSDPVVGVVQLIRNTADATIRGLDFEGSWVISDSLFMTATVGYVDGKYDDVQFDLNGDGLVDAADRSLKLPRLAPWSYGAQLIYTRDFNWGTLTLQGSGYRRDPAKYTDNNRGSLRAADMFDARISADVMDNRLSISAFGKNLKNEATIGGDTQLPANFPGGPQFFYPPLRGPGATFSPLNKGRIYGIELIYYSN